MPKFDRAARQPTQTSPIATTTRMATAEGGAGWSRDVKSELYLLAVTNLVSENTFYESGRDRDGRFARLVAQATAEDPDWTARLIRWLRSDANMRSASLVAAAEYVKAGGPNGRAVVASALQRADEPGEMLAYWHAVHGRQVPQPVKRGVADAAVRLFDERAALKYDGLSKAYRLGDVIELTHPKPVAAWQHDLFRWLIDRRHGRENPRVGEAMTTVRARAAHDAVPVAERRSLLAADDCADRLRVAGMTWESLAGWLQGPMDAAAWEAVIPSMGIFALIRNLRNFDEAGVSDAVAAEVAAKISDPQVVAKSRLFPLRFLSAYQVVPSLRWAWPLEQAVQHSLANVPALPGRTLVLVDLSGSMWAPLSARSDLQRWEAAALFGLALGLRAQHADVYVYGSTHHRVSLPKAGALLPAVKGMCSLGGTDTWGTFARTWAGHDRAVILTDEQAHPGRLPGVKEPIVTFNVAGYQAAHVEAGPNRVTVGGLTDQGFRMLDLLDRRARGDWPF